MTMAYGVETGTRAHEADAPASEGRPDSDARSIGVIVSDLWDKTEKLVRQEMRLGIAEAEEKVDALKTELDDRLRVLKVQGAAKAIGGVVALAGAFTIVAAVVLLLARVMPPWAAALLTGAVLSAAGFALLKREVELPAPPPARKFVPERTIETVKADIQAIQEATHDNAK